jgi:hypothetical protein
MFEKISVWIEYDVNSLSYDYDGAKPFYIYFNYWYCNRAYIDRFLKFIKTHVRTCEETDKSMLTLRYAKVYARDDYVEFNKKSAPKRKLESVYLKKELKQKMRKRSRRRKRRTITMTMAMKNMMMIMTMMTMMTMKMPLLKRKKMMNEILKKKKKHMELQKKVNLKRLKMILSV